MESYKGERKINLAKDFVYSMNRTLPPLDMTAGMRTFGQTTPHNWKYTSLIYGMTKYSQSGLESAIDAVQSHGSITPMGTAFNAAAGDLKNSRGTIALILVSDGQDPEIPEVPLNDEVQALKAEYGDRLCIYTVGIGDNPGGLSRLKRIADMGECGFFISADEVSSADAMADFVVRVFLSKLKDSDGDGVYDKYDQCPDTPPGVAVDAQGCPLPPPAKKSFKDTDGDGMFDPEDVCPNTPPRAVVDEDGCRLLGMVQFDFDRYNIKREYKPFLEDAVILLKDNPMTRMEIHGHTDSIGTSEYNQGLSERRAQTVRQYLIRKGIHAERLMIIGHGFRQPIETNETAKGRARNRRAVLRPVR
jgi:OOP family OmpA-OmpF porin